MPINGTPLNDILDGTSGADEIFGLAGSDTINGLGGNDTIYGGLGNDTLNGGDDNDLFVENEVTSLNDVFNGGAGTDTIELRVVSNPIQTQAGPVSPHILSAANALSSIERLVFASQSGSVVQGVMLNSAVTSSGLTEVVAGAGRDFLALLTGSAVGTFTIPTLTYTGFSPVSANAWENSGDAVILVSAAATGSAVTLNAVNGLNVTQILIGGNGNDTLNGSTSGDSLNGGGGANQLNGNGGNDSLAITNQYLANNAGGFLPVANFTGAGSTLNGGDGTDVLSIGGFVHLEATLVSIEGVQLQPGFIPPVANTAKQDAAVLVLEQAYFAMLPSNAFFTGTGTVAFVPNDGTSLSLASYVLPPGQAVEFVLIAGDGDALTFTGSAGDDTIELSAGNQTAIGGAGADVIFFGAGNQVATGGTGADHFRIGIGSGQVTDFTIGADKIAFTDTGITNIGRLSDLNITQTGAHVTINADSGGEHFEIVLQNTLLGNLSASDVVLDTGGFAEIDFGTDFADFLFGFELNDELHGGGGNDRIYGGGGTDKLYGDAGDDRIILDGAIAGAGIYDGGAGFDSLQLRSFATNSFYGIFGQVTGIERIGFDTEASQAITGVVVFQTLGTGLGTIEGGDGRDTFVVLATAGGSYSLSGLTLANWTTSSPAANGGDVLVLTTAQDLTANVTLTARSDVGNQVLIGAKGNDTLNGSGFADVLTGADGSDFLTGGLGDDTLDGGSNIDTAVVAGNRAAYTVTQTSTGVFQVVGPDGTDTLLGVEFLQFADELLRLLPGTGTTVDFNTDPDTYMGAIRDFDGNNLGAGDGWLRIGSGDVDGDGDLDQIFVNRTIGRFAEVATGPDGKVYFSDHGWAGETRVVGIYIDPEVVADPSKAGGPFDSQRRFQNDLLIENINGVLGAADYDHDGLQEVYFRLTDGTAYLHAYMHADGNIQYANYQSQQQVIDFLTAEGWGPETWAGWFPSGAEAPRAPKVATVTETQSLELGALSYAGDSSGGWMAEYQATMAVL